MSMATHTTMSIPRHQRTKTFVITPSLSRAFRVDHVLRARSPRLAIDREWELENERTRLKV